ncbi:MAG: arginase [Burkholderiales bacterium]
MGVACGAGARDPRCADGPEALRRGELVSRLRRSGLEAAWSATLRAQGGIESIRAVCSVTEQLERRSRELVSRGRFPVVLGGDHSCAIGTWKGIARALAPLGPLGLVWIDAHMDAHTPETTPSGMLHGMPVACLLGHGDPRLALDRCSALDPRRVCLVGVRSFEAGEAALLDRLGVRVFPMREVGRRGLSSVMEEALAIARSGTGGYGISLDLDAVDPLDAPGVGSAVAGGIRAADLRGALTRLRHDPACVALEIAEYNPHRDRNGATARLIGDLALELLAPVRQDLALAA